MWAGMWRSLGFLVGVCHQPLQANVPTVPRSQTKGTLRLTNISAGAMGQTGLPSSEENWGGGLWGKEITPGREKEGQGVWILYANSGIS